ncbi:MAG: hypothetical protein ABIZ04_11780 [Opitutus sp.]
MFESRHSPLLPTRRFYARLARSFAWGTALILVSLVIGMAGYHRFEHLAWIDAFLNASMILSGMGPVAEMHSSGAKLFAGCYAIYSGIALISTAALFFAPIIHRLLHRFHFEDSDEH